ncbi:FecR domain-containing protein [Chitinophaga sp. MM2321]|uniref:FecR family protein n=1 Tax=Chitinophaga sp. MM2321 TaxID=3137178 RepID=UPI0032D59D6A
MDKSSLERFFTNQCSDAERKSVIRWLLNPENDLIVKEWMREHWDFICALDLNSHQDNPDIEMIWASIQQEIQHKELIAGSFRDIPAPNPRLLYVRHKAKHFMAAAAVIAAIVFGIYFLWSDNPTGTHPVANQKPVNLKPDIAPPGGNKAVLTLANGSTIYLDSAGSGTLAVQDQVHVIKKDNGEIVYTGAAANTITYNTLSLPKGSKPIRLVLSDRSIVWLNAASSITYPTGFMGDKRKVTITGEAYFEVAKNPAMPFYVAHGDMMVKVLGTHFNVNTYSDEQNVKVTLLEGRVAVSQGARNEELKPGQQASLSEKDIQLIQSVDLAEVMAWKNDQFYFSGTDIKTIMHQVERYYNVEVQYKDNVPYKFVAKISRDVNLSQFLEKLELTNLVHFKIDGNVVIVSK